MKFTTTLALVLLLGAGLALYLSRPGLPFAPWSSAPPPPRDVADTRQALAGLTPDRLASVVVRRDGKDVALLERTFSDGWVTSGDWPASASEATRVFDLVGGLHSRFVAEASTREKLPVTIDVLTRDDVALAAAAMAGDVLTDHPLAAAVSWAATRQARRLRLAIGEPADGDYRFVRPTYLRLDGRDEVLRLAPGLVGELTRPADLYRQRRLFPAERAARLNNAQERVEKLDAREVVLQQEDQSPVRLVRGPDGWELREPTRDHLDPEAAEKLLTAVADLWAEQFVTPGPATGLDRPRQSIRVTRNDGVVVTLLLGDRSRSEAPTPPMRPGAPPPPPEAYRYAKLANSDLVFEVQDGRLGDVFLAFDLLRDNRLARFNPDDAERVELRRAGDNVVLVKEKKDSWRMTSPRHAPADGEKVQELLRKLSTLEAADKDLLSPARQAGLAASVVGVARPLAALADAWLARDAETAFGLAKPSGEVTVVVREKARADDRDRSRDRTLTLRVGKPAWAANRVFVQQAGWPRVDGLDDSLTALLDKPALAYRGKQMFDFAAADVGRLVIRSAGRAALGAAVGPTIRAVPEINVVLQRDGDGWALQEPVATRADAAKVNDLLDALAKAKALAYVGEAGVEAPSIEVKVVFNDTQKPARTLYLGAARGAEPGYLARLGGDVFAVPGDLRDKLTSAALTYLPSSLWQIAPDDEITRFAIAKAGQEPYQLSRQGGAWQVTGPFAVAAPAAVVERLSAALSAPRAEEYRAYPAGDLAAYGLAKPAVTLTLDTKAGKKHTISLGVATTSGKAGRFATTGEGILVVNDALAKAVDQSALDFLDRDLLKFDDAAATSLTRQRGGETLELVKDGEAWKLTKPSPQPADDRKGPDLVRALSSLRAERVVAYKPKDLKPYGLDKPEATLTVKVGGMDKVLLVGREEGAGERVAMVKDAPLVAVLSAGDAKRLLAPALAFRSHDLARVADADTMALDAGERKVTFARPEGTWKVTKPVAADAEHDALEAYFNAVARLRADELVTDSPTADDLKKYGLDKPSARWRILNGDKLEIDLVLGGLDGKRRYARLGDKGVVFLLDDKLSAMAAAEYRPRAVWKDNVDPAQVEAVKFGSRKEPFELRKIDGTWQVVGRPDVKLDQATVSDTLSALRDLKLDRYVKDDGAELKLYGLDPAEMTLEVTTPSGGHTLLLGGVEGGSKRRYARSPSAKFKDVFVLDETASARLTRGLTVLTKPAPKGGADF